MDLKEIQKIKDRINKQAIRIKKAFLLKFYADQQKEYSNKLFSFGCDTTSEALSILKSFKAKNNNIRKIFVESNNLNFYNGSQLVMYSIELPKVNNEVVFYDIVNKDITLNNNQMTVLTIKKNYHVIN